MREFGNFDFEVVVLQMKLVIGSGDEALEQWDVPSVSGGCKFLEERIFRGSMSAPSCIKSPLLLCNDG
jgi:hypothetical protein